MSGKASTLSALLLIGSVAGSPVLACGDSEAGLSCDDSGSGAEMSAKWMLKRVVAAIDRDEAAALSIFTKGTDGFRTADTYVFCVGPDGVMSAHPNPILQGHDVRDLHDKTGNYFIRTMVDAAKPGKVSMIRYLFPKPGSTVEEPKTTYYTKAGDQTCGVGVYDSDMLAPKAATPDARVAQLRQKLDSQIPASAKADWTAFLEALNAQAAAKTAVVAEARRNLKAAAAALDPADQKTAGTEGAD
ncbi:cache domain-containing protein [Methylobacterium sp. NEAU K]|uniref:cache domain-containing protein n=1 Tax=Methylobacterium sp. NEAU K TaxID=3064946 RepID=UPI0027376D91|nr:cache domain-containing protein [Methylobacterium sp. NEAU K]MDP4006833.1 cache domain-containing protein [Methylobacterium sp. NEAU K]